MRRAATLIAVLTASLALAQTPPPEVTFNDGFQAYGTQANPPGWIDTSVGQPRPTAQGLYKTWPDPLDKKSTNVVYGTHSSSGKPEGNNPRIGTFSTYSTKTFSGKGRFEYRGRVIRDDADARIGLTFFSAYPEVDRYYLIGLWSQPSGKLTMQLFSIGGSAQFSGTTDSNFTLPVNAWTHFAIQVDDTNNQTRVRARFWNEGTAEPTTFSIEAVDSSAARLTSGRIGIWSAVKGKNYVDDLSAKSPVDFTAPLISILESGTPLLDGAVFKRDAIPEIKVSDDLSAVNFTATLNGAPHTSLTPVTTERWHTLIVKASDSAGNATETERKFLVDKTPPVLSALESGNPFPANFYFNRDVVITGNAVDVSNTAVTATIDSQPYTPGTPYGVEGTHQLSLTAVDEAGWTTTIGPFPFTIDKTAPVLTFTSHQNGAVLTTAQAIVVGGSDDAVTILLGGTPATLDATAKTFTRPVALLEGANSIVATGTDRAGNTGSATLSLVVDTRAPELTITTPAADACVDATTLTVSGTIAEARIESVTVNGVNATVTGDTWTVSVPVAEGKVALNIEAKDTSGHTTSLSRNVTVDRTAPVLEVTNNGSPFTATLVNRSVSLFIRATDADTKVTPTATLDGSPYTSGAAITTEGAHTVVVKATDCAGHVTEQTFEFTIDLTAPTIRELAPANGSTSGTKPATISGRTDNDVASVVIDTTELRATPAGDGAFTLANVPFAEGTNLFTLIATDRAGNIGTVEYSVVVRTTAPVVEIRESGFPIADGTLYNRAVTPVIRVANEPQATIAATLNGNTYTSATTISNDGEYRLRATATDSLGHSATEEVTFAIDRTPPVVEITSPANEAVIQGDRVEVRGTVGDAVAATLNGSPLVIGNGGAFSVEMPLDYGANPFVVSARDRAGNNGADDVTVTRDDIGAGLILTYPPDQSLTNRTTTDVVGRLLTAGRATTVKVGTQNVAVDPTGGFRVSGYALVEGENTITATATAANGVATSATTRVTGDFTPPSLTILESSQPLTDGARFGTQAVLSVQSEDAGGGPVTTEVTIDGTLAATLPATVSTAGGHSVVAIARDRAGNQARAERMLFIGAGTATADCKLEGFDPSNNAVVLAGRATLVGRSGGAIGVKVNGVPAIVADGAFSATVELPNEGPNTVTIACTDANGTPTGTPATLVLQRVTGEPSIAITTPEEGFITSQATIAVTGTVGPGVTSVDVNGVAAAINGTTFVVPAVNLADGMNILSARGRNSAGRTATASRRGTYEKDAPSIVITTPGGNTATGSNRITVSGTYTNLDPTSIVVTNLAGNQTKSATAERFSDTTGSFTALDVPLSSGEQTLRVSGRDRLNRPASATVIVRLVAGAPSVTISSPANHSYFPGGSTTFSVSGTFSAAAGSTVDVNGTAATLNGSSYTATATFSGGVTTPVVARVTEPTGASATATAFVTQLVDAPKVVESFPAPDATEVDAGALMLVLFSQPMDVTTMNGAFRLEDGNGAPISGTLLLDKDVLTFAPATLLSGGRYTLRVSTAAKNLAGTALASAFSSSFLVAASAPSTPPVITPAGDAVCGQSVTISGTATPGARLRLESATLVLTASADSQGRFTFTYPISGQSGFALVRVRIVGSDGSVSPAAELTVRVDCSGPQVLNASFDRSINKLTISFSEALDASTVSVGGAGIVLALSDGSTVGGTAGVTGNSVTVTPASDLTQRAFTLTVGTQIEDTTGNRLTAPYSQEFAVGAGGQPEPGDGSGFISGEVYDATTGRPLPGATIAVDVASPSPITTTTDARGRYLARLPEGAHTISATHAGHTSVWREIIVPAGAGVIPIDIRLTARGETKTSDGSALALLHGGDTAVTKKVELAIPASALPAGGKVALTAIGAQALTGLLPLGWSPISSAEVHVEGTLNTATLTFHTPAGAVTSAAQNLTAVHYDAARDEWRVLASTVNVGSDGRVSFAIPGAGAYALVYPDKAPGLTAPPLPVAGDVLQGVPAAAPDAPELVDRDFKLDPPIVLPTGRTVATLRIEGAGTAKFPSGTAVQAYIDEDLRLADGSRLLDPPFATDLLLYRNLSGDLGIADFHLGPSPKAAQVVLEIGFEHIRVLPYPGRLDRGTLIGSEGGRVPADDRVAVEIPTGAVPEPLRATATSLTAGDLTAIGNVAGFRVVGGFQLTLQRAVQPAPQDLDGDGVPDAVPALQLFVPAAATFSVETAKMPSASAQVVLAELLDDTPHGRMFRLAAPMIPVDGADGTPLKRFTTKAIDRSVLPVDGVVREGRYVVLAAEAPIAFATGTVRMLDALGRLLDDARVSAPPLGVHDLSRTDGIYSAPVPAKPAAPFTLVPRHANTGDGAAYTHAAQVEPDQIVRVDLALVPQPPVLGSVVVLKGEPPSQGALSSGSTTTNVSLSTNIRASFSPSIDPASITADSITVTESSTGEKVNGKATADGTIGVVWTLTAGELLKPNARYLVTIAPTIRGANGATIASGASYSFTTITRILNNEVRRDRIRITIPDAQGISRVTGDPGALPAGWQALVVRRHRDFFVRYQGTAANDGSFSFFAGDDDPRDRISMGDLIDLRIVNSVGGLAGIIPLTPFVTADGRGFVAIVGEDVTFTTADGVTVEMEAGTFDVPTVVTIAKSEPAAFADIPSVATEVQYATSFKIEFDGEAKKPMEISVPVPAGYETEGRHFLLARRGESVLGPRLALADIMRVVDGKFTTVPAEGEQLVNVNMLRSGGGPATQQTLTGSEFRKYTARLLVSGIYMVHHIIPPMGSAVGFAVMQGFQASYDIMWSIFASYFEPYVHRFERPGIAIPVLTNTAFTVVGIDPSTGLEAFKRKYDPLPTGEPFSAVPIPAAQQNAGGPYPVYATPFRVEMVDLDVEDIDITSVPNFKLRLSNGNVRIDRGTPALDSDTRMQVLNVTKGTFASTSAFFGASLGASVGDRIVLLIEEQQADPNAPISIVFNESLYTGGTGTTNDDDVDAYFHEHVKFERAPEPPGGATPVFTDITAQVTFTVDSAARRLNIILPAALQREAIYRVTLKGDMGDIGTGGQVGLKLGQGTTPNPEGELSPVGGGNDLHLLFHVRKPAGQIGEWNISDRGILRGLDMSGNVLITAALDGGLIAYDTSNPAGLTGNVAPLAELPGPPEHSFQHLAVTIDRHNRVWTTAHLPIVGILRSYRLEDFANGTVTPMKGKASSIINWKLGYSGMIGLPSNTILSDRPESIPFRIKVILQDDEKNYANRELFKAGAGASVVKTYPADDIERLRVSVSWNGDLKYKYQRVTVENVTLDMRWSADASPGGAAVIDNIIARAGDRMRLIKNLRTYASVAHLGYGVAVYDANAMESNRYPGAPASDNMKEQLVLTAGKVARNCPNQPPSWGFGENYLVTDVEMRGDPANGGVYVYATHPYYGVLDLKLKLPGDGQMGTQDDACEQRGASGLVLRSNPTGNEPAVIQSLRSAIQGAGRTPFPHFGTLAQYHWHLDGTQNKKGERNSDVNEPVDRDYLLIAAMDLGLIVVEIDGRPGTAPYFPLANDNIADVIWIPGGAASVRVIQRSHMAVVTDRNGRVMLVDLKRIDERWDENNNRISGLFPTVKKALAGTSSDIYGVGADDPRIIWKSAPGVAGGMLAPVVDANTGFVFAGAMVARVMKSLSALDPKITVNVNLGDPEGLDDVSGIVPLGIAPPKDIQNEIAGRPACAPPNAFLCKDNASLGAFRIEVALPGNITHAIGGGELQLAVESERMTGAITEQTPDGFPRAHLRRKRRDGSNESGDRAATNFKMKRIVPDDMAQVLRSQSGYNRFVSPWIVAIADPRASKEYNWNGASADEKKEQGCEQCERPKHLRDLDEDDGVYELWTNGRFIAVRPELTGSTGSTIFDLSAYDYLGEDKRLETRISTIMADTVRSTEVLVASQNPPIANGALQGTLYLHSGELQTHHLDLSAGGRAETNVRFERIYRSRTLGGTVLGQGWDSQFLRRLRALPNGDVEYRDGAEVWRFTASNDGKYKSPEGLFLRLARTERGWKLLDQKWRITEFDDRGRLLYETDEFYDPAVPGSGNVIRYVYDETGRLSHIVDPVQRVSHLRYWKESDAGSAGAYPGLIREIEDWRRRKLNFHYDATDGTLLKVELPDVPNTSGGRPTVKYGYTPAGGGFSDKLELRTNLFSITDPHEAASGGAARVQFTYGTGGDDRDRLKSQKWGTGETASFTYSGTTSTSTKDALGQNRDYTLTAQPKDYISDRAHVEKLVETAVTVSSTPFGQLPTTITATPPSTSSASRTFEFTYDDHGLIRTAKLDGVRSMSYAYQDVQPQAPGYVTKSMTTSSQGGSSDSITQKIDYDSGATAATTPQAVSANDLKVEIAQPRRGSLTDQAGNNVTQLIAQCRSDALMEVLQTSGGGSGDGGTAPASSGIRVRKTYAPPNDAAEYRRAMLMESDSGGLKKKWEYPSEDKVIERDERGTVTTTDYDAQRRVLRRTVNGADLTDDESYTYDASGRLRTMTRKQGGQSVVTTYGWDVMGRQTSESTSGASVEGGSVGTTTTYDLASRTITATLEGGATKVTRLDTLGRIASQNTATGGPSPVEDFYAYDLDDNLVFHTDRSDASAMAYDGHGRLVGTLKLDGTRTTVKTDAWGRPTDVKKTAADGATTGQSTYEYTDAGRMKSMDRRIDGSQTLRTTYSWDGAERTTGIAQGNRAQTMKFDDAGRLLSAATGEGNSTTVSTPYQSTQVAGHDGVLPQNMTRNEKDGGAYQLALQYNAHSEAVTQSFGNLQWEQQRDEAGNIVSSSEPGQPSATYEYDSRGSLLKEMLPGGGENTFTYHGSGARTSFTDPTSEQTRIETDLIGRPVKNVYKDGTQESIEYEGRRVKAITDRRGRRFTFTYNTRGLIATISNNAGGVIDTIDYDGAGRVIRWKNDDALLEFSEFNMDGKPGMTVQTRYRNGAVVDRYEQKHEWTQYGQRHRWSMPQYPGMQPGNAWTKSVEQTFDAMRNVTQMRRLTFAGNATVLLSGDYRNAGRPNRRTIGTTAGKSILREYTYDAQNGLLRRVEVTSNGVLVAGSDVTYDGLRRSVAQVLGVSGGARASTWGYDGGSRLRESRIARDGDAAPSRDELTLGDFRTSLNRVKTTPVDPPTITYEESPSGHKIATMRYGNTIENFRFDGGERTEDGRFVYEYDDKARLMMVTQKALSGALTVRRVLYDYDGTDRLVGRRAEYADVSSGGTVGTWKLEDRANVIAFDGLPADTTFVWDPVSDRLSAIYRTGASSNPSIDSNGGLVRQILHGGLGLDDPIEITAADPLAPAGAAHFYPVYDEAGAGFLQVILNANGQIVSRNVAGGPYGEDDAVLLGGAVDRVAVNVTNDANGNATVDVTLRATESLDPNTLTTGLQVSVVTSSGDTVRTSSKAPVMLDSATAKWSFTESEWNALIDQQPVAVKVATNAGVATTATLTPAALSIAVTDDLRSAAWSSSAPILQAPSWAVATKPVFASSDKPVEVRESLAALSSLVSSAGNGESKGNVMYSVSNLSALASPRGFSDPARLITAAAFHAHPFQEPVTGGNYVRARWFDTRSAAWLTADPAGYVDSPNLYAYAGGDPVNHRDPTGKYEMDMHYGVTKFLAMRAGFSDRDSETIAYHALLPDLLVETDPITTTSRALKDYAAAVLLRQRGFTGPADALTASGNLRVACLRVFHFPRDENNSKIVSPNSAEAQRLSREGIATGNIKLFGLGLHPFEDSYAHSGEPSILGISGHPEEHGGFTSHSADQPHYRPGLAILAARQTYELMLDFRSSYSGNLAGSPLDWNLVEQELREYVVLENISEKKAWFAAKMVTIPDEYWDDVTRGPEDEAGMGRIERLAKTVEEYLGLGWSVIR